MAAAGQGEDAMSRGWAIGILLLAALAVLCLAPFCGVEHVPFSALCGNAEEYAKTGDDYTKVDILWKLRIPRVVLAFMAGAALATSGMVFQTVFRTTLATPWTLGVSSGASLGAVICLQQGWAFAMLGLSSVSLSACLGAVVAIVLIYFLTIGNRQGSATPTMLLAGATLVLILSSLILFLQYINEFTRTFRMLRWVVGGLESVVNVHDVLNVFPFMVSGCLLVWYLTHELNLLATGEEFAFSRGVNVKQVKTLLFFAVSLLVGAVVAVCGPIGFVGLIAPDICRRLVGPDHRYLFPATWVSGGAFLVICDTASRTLMPSADLPVGILTAMFGGPVFLGLLLSRRHEMGEI
jgi:iron complex transport system permease protein